MTAGGIARLECDLDLHPSSPRLGVARVSVELRARPSGGLECAYSVTGTSNLRIPTVDDALDAERLWEHTCFELFVGLEDGPGYEEWNFSPDGQHAHFEFEDYRHRSAERVRETSNPALRLDCEDKSLILRTEVPVRPAARQADLRLGVSAVLEGEGGTLAYWALRHPAGAPDFHRREAFAVGLSLGPRPRFTQTPT